MANPIGNMVIKVDLDGSGFNRGITGLNRQMRMVSREMSANLSKFGRYDQSLEKSKVKVDGLTKRQQIQAQKVRELKNNYDQLSKETGENSAKTQAAAAKYNEAYAELNKYERELNEATAEMKALERQQQVLNTTMGKIGNKFSELGPRLQEIGSKMQSLGRSMSMYVSAPIVAGFGLAAKKSIDFDDSMRKVKATSGATGNEFQQLRDKALEMGAKTKFSASESAEALNYMALAGWDTKDMLGGIDGVMQLAAASGEDLGQVSDIVTDSLTAFGMKAKDSGHFADVLAQTSSKANTDVRGLGEAFKYAAPVAGALGYTVEDTSIAIGLMSNAGIKGEKAGTALRTMFTNLSKPTGDMKKKMDELGISITDSNGNMLPMRDVMDQLRGKFKNLSKEQQANAASTIFGKEAMSGALAIINASDEDYQKLTKSIDGSKGAANRMSKEMEGGIGGSLRQMKSAIESMAISIGDVLAPHIRRAADFLAMLADKFTAMPGWVKAGVVGLGVFAAALGPLILTTGLFTSALGSIMSTLGPVMIGVKSAGGLMAFLGTKAPFAAKGLTLVGTAFKFMLGPIGLVIAAVVAIGTAFVVAYKKSETFRNIVHSVIDPVANGFKKLWDIAQSVFNSLKSLLSGNSLPTVDLLSKIMPRATANKVTATLMQIRQTFVNAFKAIWQFGQEIGQKLTAFWKDNGNDIIQALNNIWGFVKDFFVELKNLVWPNLKELGVLCRDIFMNIIAPAVKVAMKIIWEIMKFVWPVIKTLIVDTWNNIKDIIKGALDIIMGIVKVFSGVFTGQWGKAWEGVKQIFSGALTLIWNLVQLWFIGKILKVVRIFGGLFKGVISKAFNGIKSVIGTVLKFIWSIISSVFKRILSITKSVFTSVFNFIKSIWNSIRNAVSSAVKSLWARVKGTWSTLYNGTRGIFNKLKNWIVNLWNSIRSNITRIASNLWSRVYRTWKNLWDGTRNIFNRVKSFLVDKWDSIKRAVTGIASDLWGAVKRTFNNMKNGLANIIDKIKGHIGGMVSAIKKGLNKLIDGVNWVADKIGMDPLPKLKLHTGTSHTHSMNYVTNGKINRDTFATVGDKGRGNGPGGFRHEMIEYPNGKRVITPNRDTTAYLPKGSKVYNGAQTHAMLNGGMPRFSWGTVGKVINGIGDGAKHLGMKAWDNAKSIAKGAFKAIGDVFDYIDNPGKLVDKVLSAAGVDFSFVKGDILGGMMTAMYKKLKGAVKNLFDGWLEEGAGADLSSFDKYPKTVPYSPNRPVPGYGYNGGRHYGIDYGTPVGVTLKAPTAGVVSRMSDHGGGLVAKLLNGGFTQFFLHLSSILKTGRVRQGEAFAKTGNSGHWTSGPHLHYQVEKGNSPYITNRNTIDPEKFASMGGVGGGSKAASKWRPEIVRAAKRMGVSLSGRDIKDVISLIQTESGGRAGITQQIVDVNSGGNEAQGLLQYTPGTFASYKVRGFGNIRNGYHQLLAFFNNTSWRANLSAWQNRMARGITGWGPSGSRRFATGGLVHNGLYHLGEDGYPEWIIPTDPSRADDAAKLLALASNDISKNKRPKNFSSTNVGGNGDSNLEKKLDTMIGLLIKLVGSNEEIANKDYEPVIDNFGLGDFINKTVDKRERDTSRKQRFNAGGVFA